VEEGRFTPTNSPTPWDKVRDATQQPPVCPQILPDVDNSMADERASYIRRIRPFLLNQSEDCLTLSIYSPILVIPGSEVYPVIVYLHGESFSWGAGSLYDGSVLAAYGRVVVVTINYRLGPLGFLNSYPGAGSPGVASNFALLDQIAALSWLVDNIGHFHGDRNKVTLVGR
ncbi:Carboxylesterase type B, partial [Trinorchestia longiramus]